MRHFIVVLREGTPAYIATETVDGWWARDNLILARTNVVLSEQEMRLDPDMAPLLAAWETKDDREWAAEEAVLEAESVVDASQDSDGPGRPWSDGRSRAELEAMCDEVDQRIFRLTGAALDGENADDDVLPWVQGMTPELLFYYRLSAAMALEVRRFVNGRGDEEKAASVARYVAMEMLNSEGAGRGVKPL